MCLRKFFFRLSSLADVNRALDAQNSEQRAQNSLVSAHLFVVFRFPKVALLSQRKVTLDAAPSSSTTSQTVIRIGQERYGSC